jgi:hypothetical protein
MNDTQLKEKHDEMLDETFDMVKIGPGEWFASEVWEQIDSIGYNVSLQQFINENEEE